jgi:hypothetical protein
MDDDEGFLLYCIYFSLLLHTLSFFVSRREREKKKGPSPCFVAVYITQKYKNNNNNNNNATLCCCCCCCFSSFAFGVRILVAVARSRSRFARHGRWLLPYICQKLEMCLLGPDILKIEKNLKKLKHLKV